MPGDITTLSSFLQEEDCLSDAFFFSSCFVLCLESFLSSDKKHFRSLLDQQLRAFSSLLASSLKQSLPGVKCESSLQDQEKLTNKLSTQVLAFLAQHMVTPNRDSHWILRMFCSRKPLFLTQPCHLYAEDFTNKFSSITIEGDGRKQSRKEKKKKKDCTLNITKASKRTVQRLTM